MECSAELSPAQMSKIVVGPRQLDFGKVSPAQPAVQHFVVTNHLNTAVHVVLDLGVLEGLSCSGPASQVIPAGNTAKFALALQCHDVQVLKEKIKYCINGCHMQVGQCSRGRPQHWCWAMFCQLVIVHVLSC